MKPPVPKPLRCAIYTRKSTERNLELAFNSLDAQREACEAYVKSQSHEGWRLLPEHYDDGGLSGASLDRPALQQLLTEVREDGQLKKACTHSGRTNKPYGDDDAVNAGREIQVNNL
jgi:hypothetical protein